MAWKENSLNKQQEIFLPMTPDVTVGNIMTDTVLLTKADVGRWGNIMQVAFTVLKDKHK